MFVSTALSTEMKKLFPILTVLILLMACSQAGEKAGYSDPFLPVEDP